MLEEKNRRILIVDDNRTIHDDFRKILAARNDRAALDLAEAEILGTPLPPASPSAVNEVFELDSAYQGQEAFEKVKTSVAAGTNYSMAFVDMRMPPGWDGVETISKMWEVDSAIQVVICTAYSDYSWEEIIKKLGNVDRLLILKKPFDTVEVCQLACALTQKWHLARHAHLKLNQLQAMVAEQTSALRAEIDERRRSEEAVRQSQARYALAVAGANDGIWDWDLTAGSIFYSSRWKAMLGYTDEQISASPEEWLNRIHPDDLQPVQVALAAHFKHTVDQFRCEFRMRHQDGQYRWFLARGVAVFDAQGQPTRAAGSQTDITDRKFAEEQLRHDAFHDTLTGLANRALLIDRIEQRIRRRTDRGTFFALLFLDLDRFKVVNDSLGHDAGDQLLVSIAQRLATALRDGDTVSRADTEGLARLGGDEFVVFLDAIRSPVEAVKVAQRIVDVLSRPFLINGQEVRSSTSIGIAVGDGTYEKAADLLRDADTALYAAKKAGRGTYQMFHTEMHASAVQRLWVETELRGALDRGELQLAYQPIFSVGTGAIVELEALLRWHHPERGIVPPLEFILLAEETGLIFPIGAWVLAEACRQMKQWQRQIPALAEVSVGVNVSCKQFARDGRILETVRSALQQSQLDARYLKLEITETAVMHDVQPAIAELNALRAIGVQCHLDDFGTGYSSLGQLHQMPLEALKIDRSFVTAATTDRTGNSIVQTILALARSMDLRVIAEGVEDESQLAKLKSLGCDYAQGYHLSKPLIPADVEAFAHRHGARSLAA